MADTSLRDKTVGGFIWMFMERAGSTLVTFLVSLLLARILLPEDYGVVAVAQVFINLANVFVTQGLNAAVIQRKEAGDLEYSTAFYASMGLALVLYAGIFIGAPLVADYCGQPLVTQVLRVLALRLPVGAFNAIQRAYVSRKLQFRKFFTVTLSGTLSSAAVGIAMALLGFGPWAIVGQYLTDSLVRTVVLWLMIDWRPKRMFSFAKLREMFGFSWKVFSAALCNEIYLEFRSIVIGGEYSAEDLAYFNRGKQFPQLFFINISSAMTSVLFPVMSRQQADVNVVKRSLSRTIQTVMYILLPMMAGLAVVAEPLVLVLLTEKWLPCVLFLQIYCFNYAILPIQSILEQTYKALGRSDIVLRLFFAEKIAGILVVLLTMRHGVEAIAWGMIFSASFDTLLHMFFAGKTVGYAYGDLWRDVREPLLGCAVMLAAVFAVGQIALPVWAALVLQCVTGVMVYLAVSILMKSSALKYLLQLITRKVRSPLLMKLVSRL